MSFRTSVRTSCAEKVFAGLSASTKICQGSGVRHETVHLLQLHRSRTHRLGLIILSEICEGVSKDVRSWASRDLETLSRSPDLRCFGGRAFFAWSRTVVVGHARGSGVHHGSTDQARPERDGAGFRCVVLKMNQETDNILSDLQSTRGSLALELPKTWTIAGRREGIVFRAVDALTPGLT